MAVAALLTLVSVGCTNAEADQLSVQQFCSELEQQRAIIESFGQLETQKLPEEEAALQNLAAQAPDEISSEFGTLVDFISQAVAALATVAPGDIDGAEEALRPLADQAAAAEAAGHVVEPWVGQNCGFEIRSGSTIPQEPPTTAPAAGDPGAAGDTTTTAAG